MMFYTDWKGRVYRNKVLVSENEDVLFGGRLFHVMLGDGRIRLCGYRSEPVLFIDGKKLDLSPYSIKDELSSKGYGEIDGYQFSWYMDEHEGELDVWLVEPDGTRWEGFSKYETDS